MAPDPASGVRRPGRVAREEETGQLLHAPGVAGQVAGVGFAPVVDVDPLHPGGDHLAQLQEDQLGVIARLRQGVGAHPDQQGLVGLTAGVDAQVGGGTGGQQAPEGVEGLGPHGLPPGEIGVVRPFGIEAREPGLHDGQQVGVGVKETVHVTDVTGSERRLQDLGRPVVAVSTVRQPAVVGHVARRLLHVRHQPTSLQHLGQQVRGLLAGQMHPAELRHRIVAVFEEDAVVELLGPGQADGGVHPVVAAQVEIANELVEEQPPQALAAAGVTGEERPLDHLGQVDQGEHGPVEVCEVAPEDLGLPRGPLFGHVRAAVPVPHSGGPA